MRIKELREKAGLSQAEVAAAMEVDASTVSKWEANVAYPRASQLPKLADRFHCSIDALFGRDKKADSPPA